MKNPSVDVLLATLNGEMYIEEFLLSLAAQDGVKINLFISDDGSSDETLKIIEKFRDSFNKTSISEGPSLGAAQNFFQLLTYSRAEYVAFADQDDIWEPFHLVEAINNFNPKSSIPQIFFSSVNEFKDGTSNYSVWPNTKDLPPFQNFFFQNYARGCTIVMNKSLVELAKKTPIESDVIMHDWWVALIALGCGKIYYSSLPHVYYRLHANNAVGNRGSSKFNTIYNLIKGNWKPYSQLMLLKTLYSESMTLNEGKELNEVLSIFDMNFWPRFYFLLRFKGRFRNNISAECKVRGVILVSPFFGIKAP